MPTCECGRPDVLKKIRSPGAMPSGSIDSPIELMSAVVRGRFTLAARSTT
ncbi:hypothetical protein DM47_1872 [Burkholderia mallei]|nr:lipo, NLP/P60 family domain protein [Burkholderia pseudomallei]KOS91969.1 hypothetical protein DM45_2469 [Burkholderia mallei]KGD23944.1 lipo, NLP/P60 family domain protein [Burkholderia pseudomallei]KGD31142.1 hypothetical protein DP59_5740 [Burkholderia pseudomallei]KOS96498.1 hypothetical protein DM49_2686 [Burkholderia mallei]